MRVESPIRMRNGGWLHKTTDALAAPKRPDRLRVKKATDTELHVRFGPLCRAWYVGQDQAVKRLAKTLGVAPWALDQLHVGFDGVAFIFPEQNHCGQIVGVNRRHADGKKLCVVGSRRGLTYAEDWCDAPGPILVVEGGSDVAAGLTLGLCVVGRPSNTGGVEYLTRLLGKHDRRIILVAERDEKDRSQLGLIHDPDCRCCGMCYPGLHGARVSAERLTKQLGRLIHWSFLPMPHKDLRAWLVGKRLDLDDTGRLERIGKILCRRLIDGIHE